MAASKSMIPKFFWAILIVSVLIIARELNPFDSSMFIGHDETQAARVLEFSFNIQKGIIPPRIAPHFSFNLGYPIFNYYAPTAYWITSFIHLAGSGVAQSLELSFILALGMGGIGMFLFLNNYFDKYAGLVGALSYISSPFIATEIFVRSNVAEMWFFALFPLTLYLLSTVNNRRLFLTAIILSFLLTSHNIFSLVVMPILILYAFILKERKAWYAIIGGFALSLYFWLPALLELSQVHAQNVAALTKYTDHFLCPRQLWSSPWGFGGSIPGCISDGMSFMIGKAQITLSAAGILLFIVHINKSKLIIRNLLGLFVGLIFIGSILLTTSYSAIIWKIFSPILSLFQFPWRFLLFVIFGASFFTTYFVFTLPRLLKIVSFLFLIFALLFMNSKFFVANSVPLSTFSKQYTSNKYIEESAAYKVSEYLPISANYNLWKSIEKTDTKKYGFETIINNPFHRSISTNSIEKILLNIHSAPYWKISVDDTEYYPDSFDLLGRPVINLQPNIDHTIDILYRQTPIQQIGNIMTILTGIILVLYSYQELLWKKNTKL